MSDLVIKLPPSLQRRIRQIARRDEMSVNQFVITAVAEKTAAVEAAGYFQKRKKAASRKKFEEALAAIPDVPPVPGDEIR